MWWFVATWAALIIAFLVGVGFGRMLEQNRFTRDRMLREIEKLARREKK